MNTHQHAHPDDPRTIIVERSLEAPVFLEKPEPTAAEREARDKKDRISESALGFDLQFARELGLPKPIGRTGLKAKSFLGGSPFFSGTENVYSREQIRAWRDRVLLFAATLR